MVLLFHSVTPVAKSGVKKELFALGHIDHGLGYKGGHPPESGASLNPDDWNTWQGGSVGHRYACDLAALNHLCSGHFTANPAVFAQESLPLLL